MLKPRLHPLIAAIIALLSVVTPVRAAGTIPFALQQQVDLNGRPIQCLLNIYQSGTTATPQNIFFDFGLTQTAPNPLPCDALTGRLPMFWLADGTVHARLTDSGGTPIIDIPVLQVLGPSSGGGGGGGAVDPSSISSTGDVKWRTSSETLTGWVKMNGATIGSATSGAAGRANADTQALYIYLWNNCPQAHCVVASGRGASGLADFTANKVMSLPDLRSRGILGRDTMEAAAPASRISAASNLIQGGDGVDTPNAVGGEAVHQLTIAELAQHSHTVVDTGHTHNVNGATAVENQAFTHNFSWSGNTTASNTAGESNGHTHTVGVQNSGQPGGITNAAGGGWGGVTAVTSDVSADHSHAIPGLAYSGSSTTAAQNSNHTHNVNINTSTNSAAFAGGATGITGSGAQHNIMNNFMLGSFYIKL